MSKREDEIKCFWDGRALEYGSGLEATIPDKFLRELEIDNVLDFVKDGQRILSVGCGNGYTEFLIAGKYDVEIVGVDYSEKMILQAIARREESEKPCRDRLEFVVGDVLNLSAFYDGFDLAISCRCLINLTSFDDQVRALDEIRNCLGHGGCAVLSEDTLDGLRNLNKLREISGLHQIDPPWHNLYFERRHLLPALEERFRILEVRHFSSTYYVGSRIFNAVHASMRDEEPDYASPLNRTAAKLPPMGDYGPLELYYLKKK